MRPEYQQIWDLSKFRFLQTEARLWLFGQRFLEALLLTGMAMWLYSFSLEEEPSNFYSVAQGLLIAIPAFLSFQRTAKWHGFFDGYEQGFTDAAIPTIGGASDTDVNLRLESVLAEIARKRKEDAESDWQSSEEEMRQGLEKMKGLTPLLTLVRLRQ